MKKVICFLICSVLIVSMLPVMTSAANNYPVVYESENNDSTGTATKIAVGTIGAGEMGSYNQWLARHYGDDDDLYSLQLKAGVKYRLYLGSYEQYYKTTLLVQVLNGDGEEVPGLNPSGYIKEQGYYDFEIKASGTHYIKVWNYFDARDKRDHYYTIIVLPISSAVDDPFAGVDINNGESSSTSGFPDVQKGMVNDTSYKAIYWAVDHGIVKGYSDGYFKPEVICTREQFSIMLWRFAGEPSANAGAVNRFSDVGNFSSGSKKAVAWAVERGIVQGFSDGSFRPKAEITRAQVAVMLWRYAGQPSAGGSNKFSDIGSYSANVQKAINWAAREGIASGYKDGTFRPDNGCQRQHMAIFLYRY